MQADESGTAGDGLRQLDSQAKELHTTKQEPEAKEADLNVKTRDCGLLE